MRSGNHDLYGILGSQAFRGIAGLTREVFQKGGNAQSVSLGRGYVGFLPKNPLL
jgi:hypothetical protein